VLRGVDGGFINAFGWCNIGIEAYLRDYYPRTRDQRTIHLPRRVLRRGVRQPGGLG